MKQEEKKDNKEVEVTDDHTFKRKQKEPKTKSITPIKLFDLTPIDHPNVPHDRPVRGFRTFYFTVPDEHGNSTGRSHKDDTKNRDKQQQQEKPPTLASAIDLAFKKPRSDVRAFYEPLQLIHGEKGESQRNQIFAMVATTHKANDYRLLKEPVTLHTVSLPKKGLIKLTGINYELSNPEYYDNRKLKPEPIVRWDHTKFTLVSEACPRSRSLSQQERAGPAEPPSTLWFSTSATVIRPVPRAAHQE